MNSVEPRVLITISTHDVPIEGVAREEFIRAMREAAAVMLNGLSGSCPPISISLISHNTADNTRNVLAI